MSKISTVYDTLLTILSTIFPEKTRLFDAYIITDNPEHIMRDGYGIRKTSTDFSVSEFCRFSDSHGFEIVLTREIVHGEDQTGPIDTVVKALLEDAFEARERVYRPDELGIPTDVTQVDLGSVSSIDRVNVGNGRFVTVSIAFTVQVTEDFN